MSGFPPSPCLTHTPGAAAECALQVINAALSLGYVVWREKVELPAKQPEGYMPLKPSTAALQNWGPYITLAIPAIISYCMEGWACEVLIFFAGGRDSHKGAHRSARCHACPDREVPHP